MADSLSGPIGSVDEDLSRLRDLLRREEDRLSRIPAKPLRTASEQQRATGILEAQRAARADFLRMHAETLYLGTTEGLKRPLRLCELVAETRSRFPGVLPSQMEMDAERAQPLALQEGREIDEGIFVEAVLRSGQCGEHLLDAMRRPTARALALLADFEATGAVPLTTVQVERKGAAVHLTLQNTDCLNAEDGRLLDDLETAIDLTLLCRDARVGVIRGGVMNHPKYAGRRVFCSGLNLNALRDGRIPLVDYLLTRELGAIRKLRAGLSGWPDDERQRGVPGKPWIVAVDAFAIGGGLQLLLNADIVIAADDSWFSLPAAREGLVPGAANLRIGRALGSRLARRMVLLGQRLHASDPEANLLCDRIVPAEGIDDVIEEAVALLDTPAVAVNRHLLNLAEEPAHLFQLYMAEFACLQASRTHSDDVAAKVGSNW